MAASPEFSCTGIFKDSALLRDVRDIPQEVGPSVLLATPPAITDSEELADLLQEHLPSLAWALGDLLTWVRDALCEEDEIKIAISLACDIAVWSKLAGNALTSGTWCEPRAPAACDAIGDLIRVGEALNGLEVQPATTSQEAILLAIKRANSRDQGGAS